MKKAGLISVLFVFVLLSASASGFEIPGVVNGTVYFNDQKATVDNATAKVGEQFTVKIMVTPEIELRGISHMLSASGGVNAYEVVDGPKKSLGDWFDDRKTMKANETISYEWKLKPTSTWVGGTAPLNIAFTFFYGEVGTSKTLKFTIANIYISPAGTSTTATTTQPSGTQPSAPAVPIYVYAIIIVIICGCIIYFVKARK